MADVLEVRNLTFRYSLGRNLFSDLTLSFAEGEFTAILGRNGAGKTTLLKILSGTLQSWHNGVRLFGELTRVIPPRRRAKLIGYVPQERPANVPLTVREIVELGRIPYVGSFSRLTAADEHVISREMSAFSLDTLACKKFSELSGGERQRVLIARALAQEPRILLLDEPTAHLDLNFQKEIMDILEELSSERGLTVIFTMHNVSLALRYARRVVLLHEGRVVADGTSTEISKSPVLEGIYSEGLALLETLPKEVTK